MAKKKLSRKTYDADTKTRAGLARLMGEPTWSVAEQAGCPPSLITRWTYALGPAFAKARGLPWPPRDIMPKVKGERAPSLGIKLSTLKLGLPDASDSPQLSMPTLLSRPEPDEAPRFGRRSKYSREQRVAAARRVVLGGESLAAVARDLGEAGNMVSNWVKRYREEIMNAETNAGAPSSAPFEIDQPKTGRYSDSFKIEVVLHVLRSGLSVTEIAKQRGLRRSVIYNWYSAFGRQLAERHGLTFREQSVPKVLAAPSGPPSSMVVRSERLPSQIQPRHEPAQDAELGLQEANQQMIESALRQALRERDALKVVLEMEREEFRRSRGNGGPSSY